MKKHGVFSRVRQWFARIYAKFLSLHFAWRALIIFFGMIAFVATGAGIAALTNSTPEFGTAENTNKSVDLPTSSRPNEDDADASTSSDDDTTTEEQTKPDEQQTPQTTPTTPATGGGTDPSEPKPTLTASMTKGESDVPGKTQSFTLTITRQNGFSEPITSVTFYSAENLSCTTGSYSDSMTVTCTVPDGVTTGSVTATVKTASKTVMASASF